MPTALFPFWADQLGTPWALGMLYAAGTVGSVLVTLTSGWTKHYRYYGRAIAIAALGWGQPFPLPEFQIHSSWSFSFGIGWGIGHGQCTLSKCNVESIDPR